MTSRLTIGLDFDNTLADYDALFRDLAAERGLVAQGPAMSKRSLRDAVRRLPGGEVEWQKLQAAAYGPLLHRAAVPPGALDMVCKFAASGASVKVVSHKTVTAAFGDGRTDLRDAALGFMESNGFFSPSAAGLRRGDVYFEPTRQAKLERIRLLGCTHFVDDLEETFLEPAFPSGVCRILYAPFDAPGRPQYVVARSWPEVESVILGKRFA